MLELRGVIAQSMEQARKDKLVGNALEARVTLAIADNELRDAVAPHAAELEEFFILSHLEVVSGAETQAAVAVNTDRKCGRCWRFRPSVGLHAAHPELCERCAEVVAH
jgi:isoleucyl-tRNA synthetase